MLISQIKGADGAITVAVRNEPGETAKAVKGAASVYALAIEAADGGKSLSEVIAAHGLGETVDLDKAYAEGRFLPPITHPDAAHLHLTGTGLTHLGSAATRDSMHKKTSEEAEETLTDSMKMFRMGLENGKPKNGEKGVQPEWFYKGNGNEAAAPGAPLVSPSFALDGGEEPEMAGIYVIGKDGTPFRIGFALSNEFSDHVTERINYLYLAHSKLRPASFGPEIRIGAAPDDIRGTSKITRDGKVIFEKPFLSGEANMSHTFANLEYHHFKYGLFRAPGDVHVHMFGTATLSFADGIKPQAGDVFEIEVADFGLPLRNPLAVAAETDVTVRQL
ncbi:MULTISPECIES: AraD1 family protein [Rhizobium]|uniref:GguC family protein n=1 Tax=Rhizobium rhododendri TaxID=2506430 RepID=A0ABY8IKT8_9HYPH|nr:MULTISPECIES: AraD1 family protein [Rhizobium]MBZ5758058.1 GguC protein [Rhizobium sp. VS19-DR96]MBZ5765112.1 GguC protein [Rhizobium sp. VS19-DR129.2]MBZ5772655.1 GguC protein [Rhizobium sp. VS19-DRK62.2]MBZ5782658.1 GguC protein [Rhizobium sp. VS19-DR121]MBZ5800106.1 GguC protein [Rhizobium sp. VS19-DR181]